MTMLDPSEARRLQRVLALLASPHDGEVIAAAAAAARILDKAGMRFADLAVAADGPAADPFVRRDVTEPAWGPRRRPREVKLSRQHQFRAKLLLGSGHAWDEWERKFLHSIAAWDSSLSAKQGARLAKLEAARQAWWAENGGRA